MPSADLNPRITYEELGRLLGVTAETELVDRARRRAGEAIGRIVNELLAARTAQQLDNIAGGMMEEATRLSNSLADVLGEKQKAADAAALRNYGFEACPACGAIGQHICYPIRAHPSEEQAE